MEGKNIYSPVRLSFVWPDFKWQFARMIKIHELIINWIIHTVEYYFVDAHDVILFFSVCSDLQLIISNMSAAFIRLAANGCSQQDDNIFAESKRRAAQSVSSDFLFIIALKKVWQTRHEGIGVNEPTLRLQLSERASRLTALLAGSLALCWQYHLHCDIYHLCTSYARRIHSFHRARLSVHSGLSRFGCCCCCCVWQKSTRKALKWASFVLRHKMPSAQKFLVLLPPSEPLPYCVCVCVCAWLFSPFLDAGLMLMSVTKSIHDERELAYMVQIWNFVCSYRRLTGCWLCIPTNDARVTLDHIIMMMMREAETETVCVRFCVEKQQWSKRKWWKQKQQQREQPW